MAGFTKGLLSGTLATDGEGYLVTTSYTVVHTGPTAATSYDEIWIYATNRSSSDVTLSLGWGGDPSSNNDLEITQTITAEAGYKLIIPGLILKGNATPLTVQCTASAASAVNLTGYVNHITA